ncbi:Cation channel sperm-associated protein subunit delta [Hondaea fermentalgiana]|uniref:Cation channel sperm-associated protein subunit delta n=1 Tax=Hondaea fermentalgiana TaxID=2315210 RepID=A0A2R5GCM5_9STRA|nr:Cation channel sperm-associated protein subunit delta [Hondaea fermentalgiana]|eukprot:GBG28305.1 Cation channel sperm-associated protein subunit delta [Hondaea fermentalgiana]
MTARLTTARLTTALVAALTCATCILADNVSTRYLVDNLNRVAESGFRVGDQISITFVAGANTLTGWSVPDTGVTVSEIIGNTTIVLVFEEQGIFPISAQAQDDLGNAVDQDTIFLDIASNTINCHVWRSCFTLPNSTDCITSWTAMSSSTNTNLLLRVWLGFAADLMRRPHETFSMTERETILTEEMYLLGEQPRVSLAQGRFRSLTDPLFAFNNADDNGTALGAFDMQDKHWTFTLSTRLLGQSRVDFAGDTAQILLEGQSVSSMGCAAEARHIWLDLPKFMLEPATEDQEDLTEAPILAEDFCAPTYVMRSVAKQGSAWVVQGLMASAGGQAPLVSLVEAAPDTPGEAIIDAAPTRLGLVFLQESGLTRLDAALQTDATSLGAGTALAVDIDGLVLTRLAAPMACDWLLDHDEETRNDVLVAWNDASSSVSSIFFFRFAANSSHVHRHNFALDGEYTVLQVLPLVSSASSVALVHDGATYALLSVNEIANTVSRLPALPADIDNTAQVASPVSPDGQLLLWTDTSLYISPSGGFSWHKINFATYDLLQADFVPEQDLLFNNGDTIEQVATSMLGKFIVRTRAGRLFAGTFGLAKAVELYSPFADADTTAASLHFRPDGSLLGIEGGAGASARVYEVEQLYRITSNGADISTIDAAALDTAASLKCPFLEWYQVDPSADSFYADMNDEIVVSTSLTHDASVEGLHVSFQNSDRTLLDIRPGVESVSTSANGELIHRKRKVHLSVPPNISSRTGIGSQEQASGKAVVRATPTRLASSCDTPTKIVQVHIGCPRGRHLRYSPPEAYIEPSISVVSSDCEAEASAGSTDEEVAAIRKACTCRQYENHYNTLPREIVNEDRLLNQATYSNRDVNWTEDDVTFKFDYDTYGCPTFVPYTYAFKPGLEIWDGDVKVKDVDADFVVFEMSSREDYTYGFTAAEMGCLRRPETWDDKLANDANITDAWGSHNYQTCYVADTESTSTIDEWGTLVYEVLNATSENYITFKATTLKDAPYEFVAVVVDPDYSFCTLQARFSVEAYGIPIDGFTTFIIIFTVVMCSMLMLVCTYFYHRHDILYAAQNKDNDNESKKKL